MVLVTRSHIYAPSLFLSQLSEPQKSCYAAVTLVGTCHVIFITDMTHGFAAVCSITLDVDFFFFFALARQPLVGGAASLLRLHHHTRTHHIR